VIVDAGVGTASDAAIAMELGCDGVLMNTAIAEAKNPVMMARSMRLAVEAGRLAYLAGRMAKKRYATPRAAGGLFRANSIQAHHGRPPSRPSSTPASAASDSSTIPFLEQIVPIRIRFLDKRQFPLALPTLQTCFALYRLGVQRNSSNHTSRVTACAFTKVEPRPRDGLGCGHEDRRSLRYRACRCAC